MHFEINVFESENLIREVAKAACQPVHELSDPECTG